jgi:outer membrane protein assembly factor BamA
MPRNPLAQLLLAAQIVCPGRAAAPADAAAAAPAPVPPDAAAAPVLLQGLDVQGGSEDDAAFAKVAAGLVLGAPMEDPGFQTTLAAIRRTDRFREVAGGVSPGPGGARVWLRLDPWPAVQRLEWRGDARLPAVQKRIRGLRTGMRPGDLRLAAWTEDLRKRLAEAGYPEAQVAWSREQGDRTLAIIVATGAGAVVRRVEVEGNPAPYTAQEIIAFTKVKPGLSLWSPATQLEAIRNLRKVLRNHHRYEARVDFEWEAGTLRVTVAPGPKVNLVAEGDGLGLTTSLADLVPLVRADSYSPELLDEGDRRIVRFFRNQGFLDAQVGHRREMTRTSPPGYQEVTVTYTIHKGERTRLAEVVFEGNTVFSEAELRQAAALPGAFLDLGRPQATPELLDALEDRVKAFYLGRGYPDVKLRRQLELRDGRHQLVFSVQEGPRRLLQWLRLELPPGGFGDPWTLGESLPLIFSDKLTAVSADARSRIYRSDRRGLESIRGTLTRSPLPAPGEPAGPVVLTFTLAQPIPLLKVDLTRVYTALKQQRLPALGLVRPTVRMNLEPAGAGTGVSIQVPAQPLEKIQRLVVAGSDKTRARAVLRETQLQPGAPLDSDQLARAQARLSYLGAFQRVDLRSLAEDNPAAGAKAAQPEAGQPEPEDGQPADGKPAEGKADAAGTRQAGPPVPWKEGDLLLSLEERPPYVITNSFGYDSNQGYYIGAGLQQLNVGGMGRTIDYNIRAGNGTIQNPTLARIFPTGTYIRSVDSFSVGYTDPWFAPGPLQSWLPDRTQYHAESAYIQEQQALYIIRRRRLLNSLQWSLTPQVSFQLGYRWERVDVASAIEGIGTEELAILARYPTQATISAPFAQVARDTRDNSFDPTRGMYSVARVEFANQLFLTSANSSFVKVDLKNQWTWPVGYRAKAGVVALGLHVGIARPTASSANDLPLSERFFAGGPFSFRGVEPDALGVQTQIPLRYTSGPAAGQPVVGANGQPVTYATPVGGQGLALISLEYRFPLVRPTVWGEVFVDSGQVYESLTHQAAQPGVNGGPAIPATSFPPFRTALGLGLIFKIGIPLKLEYAADVKRILGLSRSQDDVDTQLKSVLISAGFQF